MSGAVTAAAIVHLKRAQTKALSLRGSNIHPDSVPAPSAIRLKRGLLVERIRLERVLSRGAVRVNGWAAIIILISLLVVHTSDLGARRETGVILGRALDLDGDDFKETISLEGVKEMFQRLGLNIRKLSLSSPEYLPTPTELLLVSEPASFDRPVAAPGGDAIVVDAPSGFTIVAWIMPDEATVAHHESRLLLQRPWTRRWTTGGSCWAWRFPGELAALSRADAGPTPGSMATLRRPYAGPLSAPYHLCIGSMLALDRRVRGRCARQPRRSRRGARRPSVSVGSAWPL